MKRLISVLSASLFIFLIACDKETTEPAGPAGPSGPSTPPVGDPSMSVTIDGEDIEITSMSAVLLHTTLTAASEPHNTMKVETWIAGSKFAIRAKTFHFMNPPEEGVFVKKYSTNTGDQDEDTPYNNCGYGPDYFRCEKGKVSYYSPDFYETRAISGKPYGVVEITYLDTINYVVSGNFEATLYKMFEFDPDSMMVSGEFENIPYDIEYW